VDAVSASAAFREGDVAAKARISQNMEKKRIRRIKIMMSIRMFPPNDFDIGRAGSGSRKGIVSFHGLLVQKAMQFPCPFEPNPGSMSAGPADQGEKRTRRASTLKNEKFS